MMALVPGTTAAIDAARWYALCAMRRDAAFWAARSPWIYADRVRYFLRWRDLFRGRLGTFDFSIRDRRGLSDGWAKHELPWRGAEA